MKSLKLAFVTVLGFALAGCAPRQQVLVRAAPRANRPPTVLPRQPSHPAEIPAPQPQKTPLQTADYRPHLKAHPGHARIDFVGDINVGRAVGTALEENGPGWAFQEIKPVFDQADMVVANLESPVGTGGVKYLDKAVYLRGRPEDLDALSLGGFGLVTLANNHILDFGPEVMNQTMEALDQRGIAYTGLLVPGQKRGRPVTLEVQGLKITFLAFCSVCPGEFEARGKAPGVEVALPSVMVPQVKAARKVSDFVVVLVHWGTEYFGSNPLQKKLARVLAAAGADMVIGAHPHVLQEVKRVGRSLVAYSLGNFLFDLSYPVAHDSCILVVDLKKGQPPAWKAVPLDLASGRPRLLAETDPQAARIRKILDKGYSYKGRKTYDAWKN